MELPLPARGGITRSFNTLSTEPSILWQFVAKIIEIFTDSIRFSAITKTLLSKAFFTQEFKVLCKCLYKAFYREFKIVLSRCQIIGFARKHVLCLQEDLVRRNGIPISIPINVKNFQTAILEFPCKNFSCKIYHEALQEESQHLLRGKIQILLRTKNSIWVPFIQESRFLVLHFGPFHYIVLATHRISVRWMTD